MTPPRFSLLASTAIGAAMFLCGLAPAQAQLSTLTTLYSFTGGSDGKFPDFDVVLGSDGQFYGTTVQGGANGEGTVYKIKAGGVLTTLYSFSALDGSGHNADGAVPQAALVAGSDGNFYGTTSAGGPHGAGTVFKIAPDGTFTLLHAFNADIDGENADGFAPASALLQASDGNLYGTTQGGPHGSGTVFSITPDGFFSTLYAFGAYGETGIASDGFGPESLTEGADGNLYGETIAGGRYAYDNTENGDGTVFQLTPEGALTRLHSFGAPPNYYLYGVTPSDGLVQGTDGSFYGMTTDGGNYGGGTIFKITSDGAYTGLRIFQGNYPERKGIVGRNPLGKLTLASDGAFYGTTATTAFRFTQGGLVQALHNFADDPHPGNVSSGLIEYKDGRLYGMNGTGGANGFGSFYRLTLVNKFGFTAAIDKLPETASNVTVVITHAGLSLEPVTVQYATADGTATDGHDYTATSGTLTWAVGDNSSRPIFITLLNPGKEYPNGQRQFTVNLSNPTGGAILGTTPTATVVLLGTTDAPVITSPTTASGTQGAAFSYQITASPAATSYKVLGLPQGLVLNAQTGAISGTPTGAGTFTLTLEADNQGGNGTATLTLTIAAVAPVITSATTTAAVAGDAFSYQITADYGPRRYAVEGLPSGLTLNPQTGLISGTTNGVGMFMLTLHAFNPVGQGTQTLTLTVSRVTPVITSATFANGTVGTAFSYQITAAHDPAQFHALRLPTGLSVNASTGLISGTPTTAGRFRLTLEAVNSAGTGTATLSLAISN